MRFQRLKAGDPTVALPLYSTTCCTGELVVQRGTPEERFYLVKEGLCAQTISISGSDNAVVREYRVGE